MDAPLCKSKRQKICNPHTASVIALQVAKFQYAPIPTQSSQVPVFHWHCEEQGCEAPHLQYHVSGRIAVLMDDGRRQEFRTGEGSLIPPGHHARVIGNGPSMVVFILRAICGSSAIPCGVPC
jgi:hypothetical protein